DRGKHRGKRREERCWFPLSKAVLSLPLRFPQKRAFFSRALSLSENPPLKWSRARALRLPADRPPRLSGPFVFIGPWIHVALGRCAPSPPGAACQCAPLSGACLSSEFAPPTPPSP